ncbi:PIN domain-containing protein [Ruminococcus sp. FC2018]|uniref:PIN domain-containing protein n=1 Tax=Ruminococcus sp. FC2018 TaxID=1410617 RepID=UPI00048E803C|nr:PIN domain-containing protein [Ruminococcus sp. FC2018]
MKIYLVDFENVKSKGLEGVDKLSETDSVIIFFSENSDTLSFEMHQKVLSSKADIEYFKVSVGGKNALDFQLSTLLGYMVAKETYSHIFVISNDKGFDFLHAFWGGNYIDTPKTHVYRTKTISGAIEYTINEASNQKVRAEAETESEDTDDAQQEAVTRQAVQEKAAEEKSEPSAKRRSSARKVQDFDTTFKGLLKDACDENSYGIVKELFIKSQTKEEFHNSLAKEYKQDGTEIYKAVKSRYIKLKEKLEKELAKAPAPQQEQPADKLDEILAQSCSAENIQRIRRCIENTASKKELYISMVKEFQKKKGCEYYNIIKPHYSEITQKVSES